jgi:hypothetical protein
MHVYARAKPGAQLEDLGILFVTPKPKRAKLVHIRYRGKQLTAVVTSIVPQNWESRPIIVPAIHVEIAGAA